MNSHCPKCGSDQILNDECLKCGVIVSKAHNPPGARSGNPVSYVAPAAQHSSTPDSYVWKPPTLRDPVASSTREIKHLQRNLLLAVITLVILGGAYQVYKYFERQAANYGGYYRNSYDFFSLNFPDKGWSHYDPGYLKAPEFKDAKDAFYRGNDPDDPQIVMAIWTEGIANPVPERLDDATAVQLKGAIEQEVLKRMKNQSLDCEITESKMIRIGGNDGFVIFADLEKNGTNMKTVIYCGFNQRRAYTIQFLGEDHHLLENRAEMERMMTSFSFSISLI